MDHLVEVENLSFAYETGPILEGVGFTVTRGDFVAIIGSNGTGKTTLLRLLLGEFMPTGGTIRLLGEDIRHFNRWPLIGYVPQGGMGTGGFPATAAEVVQASLYSRIGLMRFPRREHRERTLQALALVDMERYASHMVGSLSGGQLQRVLIARVLAAEPEMMLLDEPATGIDSRNAEVLYSLLDRLNHQKGLTVIMVTHDVARARSHVSRTLCLEEGSLVELLPDQVEDELRHRHHHPHPADALEEEPHGHL